MRVITSNPVTIRGQARKSRRNVSRFSSFDTGSFADVLKFQTWVNNTKKPFIPLALTGKYDGITDGAYKQYGKEYEMTAGQTSGTGIKNPDLFDRSGKFQEYKEKMKNFFRPADPLPPKTIAKRKPNMSPAPAQEAKGLSNMTKVLIATGITLTAVLIIANIGKLKAQRV